MSRGEFYKVGKKREDFFCSFRYNPTVSPENPGRKENIMKRKQFTFYLSFFENIESLQTNKEKLQAYQLLCDYALNHTEPDLSDKKPCAAAVFRAVRPVLDAAHRRAENMTTVRNSTPTPAKDPLY